MARSGPALLIAIGLFLTIGARADVIVFEDNFDGNDFHDVWTLVDGNVDVGAFSDLCNNGAGGYCVDTEGTGPGANAAFFLANPLTLSTGDYTFSFDWGNNAGLYPAPSTLEWFIYGEPDGNPLFALTVAQGVVDSGAGHDWIYETVTTSFSWPVATNLENVIIGFEQTGIEGNLGGTVLDNVRLVKVPAPAPLLLLALGLLTLIPRRRH